MSTWTARAHEQRQAQAATLAAVLRDADPIVLERTYRATAAGDERKLRGIPAIGRSVAGCIPGTRPGGNL
jgi:hypothetical protein